MVALPGICIVTFNIPLNDVKFCFLLNYFWQCLPILITFKPEVLLTYNYFYCTFLSAFSHLLSQHDFEKKKNASGDKGDHLCIKRVETFFNGLKIVAYCGFFSRMQREEIGLGWSGWRGWKNRTDLSQNIKRQIGQSKTNRTVKRQSKH